MRKIIFSGLLLAAMVGCQSDDAATTNNPNNGPVQFENVKQDMLSGDAVTSGNFVIKTAGEWTAFKEMVNAAYQEDIDALEGVTVDFAAYDVISTVDQWHPNGGHGIEVSSVVRDNEGITVSVETIGEGNGTLVVTQPFHVVKISKTTLPITFE
jgi:hypothetical protein